MIRFLVRRTLLAVLTLFVVTVVAYALIQMPPGDYVDAHMQAIESYANIAFSIEDANELADALRKRWGLDKPIAYQYVMWMSRVVRGDFGMSLVHAKPIKDVLSDRMLMTVILTMSTIGFTWLMAIPIGIYSAVRQRSVEDYTFTFLGFIGLAVPDFLLALVMMYFFFVWFDFDVGGLQSRQYMGAPISVAKVFDMAEHLVIPVIVLGTSGTAGLIRIMRANLLDELRKPYVVTARAKGLPEMRVILKYPLRVALNPLISSVGYILPALISGSVIVSVVLSLPTVGPVLLQSLLGEDMFLAGTIILFLAMLTIIGTLISDILLVIIDPRIRLETE